jgi:hypothetical protein
MWVARTIKPGEGAAMPSPSTRAELAPNHKLLAREDKYARGVTDIFYPFFSASVASADGGS